MRAGPPHPGPVRRELDARALGDDPYPLLNSAVAPRPILWVATRSPSGVDNLAPFSWVTVASTRPPVVCFTSAAGTDTLAHCRSRGEFVLCLPPDSLLDRVNLTGVAFPPDVSEVAAAGLTSEPSAVVAVSRIVESPLVLECRVVGERTFGDGKSASSVVFGEVVHLAADEAVLGDDGLPDLARVRPLSRLNRDLWGTLGPLLAVTTMTTDEAGVPGPGR